MLVVVQNSWAPIDEEVNHLLTQDCKLLRLTLLHSSCTSGPPTSTPICICILCVVCINLMTRGQDARPPGNTTHQKVKSLRNLLYFFAIIKLVPKNSEHAGLMIRIITRQMQDFTQLIEIRSNKEDLKTINTKEFLRQF